ncbi:hypothetical protein MOQ72_43715 [Saccharopolyspora sp. K220]|uniref:hypothetical protein n=1 Tax=Saccharopolyspora soli TaxID=2926618 RepID=UPI001F5971EC|nr:hypothetical protein [Saccharopolyspora soli]MCI2424320.1 hypothetical protein [Saccharopolyspora soli]
MDARTDRPTGAETITMEGTDQHAWRTSRGDWMTSWTGIALYSREQVLALVEYAAMLETTGPLTGLTEDELDELAFAWSDVLDMAADDVRDDLLRGYVTAAGASHATPS